MTLKQFFEHGAHDVENNVQQFADTFVREGLQRPVNGAIQLASVGYKHKLPELHLVRENEGPMTVADQFGYDLGKLADFMVVNKLTHGKFNVDDSTSAAQVLKTGFAYGGISGGVFTPVDSTDSQDFWSRRLENAVTQGATFGVGRLVSQRVIYRKPDAMSSYPTEQTALTGIYSGYLPAKLLSGDDSSTREAPTTHKKDTIVNPPGQVKPSQADAHATAPVPLPGLSGAGFDLTVPDSPSAPSAQGTATRFSAKIPLERIGLDGKFDQSGLAKRVDRLYEKDGMDRQQTIWVAQSGKEVVLTGKVHSKKELSLLVAAAESAGYASDVNLSAVKIV